MYLFIASSYISISELRDPGVNTAILNYALAPKQRPATTLFVVQVFAHLAIIPMLLYASWWQYLVSFAVYFFTGCLGMSMTYHRLLSHRSWQAPGWFKYVGVICGSLGLTGSALAWASVHRTHHRFSDQIRDPHSPHQEPWWKVQFLSMYHRPDLRTARDLLQDSFIVWTHRHYLGLQVLYISLLLVISPFAVVYAYLVPAAILWQAGSSVNTIGHLFGYRRFATGDQSRNNVALGFLLWGEGWHNNHHRNPSAKSFSRHWLELDISHILIRLCEGRADLKQ
jgi:stearoyl-CoA desaturase (delta-9 desaturase)